MLIAIDGPGAVGKSTVGKIVAQKLGYQFIDTGEMYRALTWLTFHLNVDLEDEQTLGKLAAEARIKFESQAILVDHYNIASEIHTPAVEAGVSQVAKIPEVRKVLVSQQQDMAKNRSVVMAGRDIGTVVLPQAELKIFLTASLEERARRRYLEQGGEEKSDYETILAELRRRDDLDSQRSLSPLRPAPDARIIDTEGLDSEQVAAKIISLME